MIMSTWNGDALMTYTAYHHMPRAATQEKLRMAAPTNSVRSLKAPVKSTKQGQKARNSRSMPYDTLMTEPAIVATACAFGGLKPLLQSWDQPTSRRPQVCILA